MSKLEDNIVCYLGLDLVCPTKASRIWCVQFEKAWFGVSDPNMCLLIYTHAY